MAKIILLRHAHSVANSAGVLSGQLPGVALSKEGRKQAESLITRIGRSPFHSIRVSPMQRCEETIKPWITSNKVQSFDNYMIDSGIIEVDYGSWSGRKLSGLRREPMWKLIQSKPSKVRFPNGEKLSGMQRRALQSVDEAYLSKREGNHLFVSHGDVIKAMIAGLIGLHLDEFQSLVIDPASISILDFDGEKARLVLFNDTTTTIANLLTHSKRSRVLLGGGSGAKVGRT